MKCRENINFFPKFALLSYYTLDSIVLTSNKWMFFQVSLLNFLKNINNPISNPAWTTLSTWKSLAWNEIWVLRMLSRRSNSNTPIPSMQQQRDALLIICIPCTDSERVEGSYKWVESSESIFPRLSNNVLGDRAEKWKIRKIRSERKRMGSGNNYKANSVQNIGKTQQHGHPDAWRLDPDINGGKAAIRIWVVIHSICTV